MSEWREAALSDVAGISLSNVDKKILPDEIDVLLCNYMDVYANRYITSKLNFSLGSVNKQELEKFRLNEQDVIITKDSETADDIAVPAVVTENIDSLVCGYHLAIIRPHSHELDGPFLMNLFQIPEVKNQFSNYANGITRYGLTKDAIYKIRLRFPTSLPEQHKIAKILGTVDAVLEKTQAAIEKYKAIKHGMMHDLFARGLDENGKLRPRYEDAPQLYKKTDLGWLPKEWEVVSLEYSEVDIIDGDRGLNYPNQNELFNFGFCIFLNAHNVTANGFKFDNMQFITREKDQLMGTGKLMHHDVVITTRGTVGNIAYYDVNISFEHIRINSGMIILRNRYVDMSSKFLYVSLKEYIFNKEFQKVISGSAQPQLPIKDLKKFRFIKPLYPEQARLIIIAGSIHNKIEQEYRTLEKLNHLKQGLMQDLLTGRKRVKVENELKNTLESKAIN